MSNKTIKETKRELYARILKLADTYPQEVWIPLYERVGTSHTMKELDIVIKRMKIWEEKNDV